MLKYRDELEARGHVIWIITHAQPGIHVRLPRVISVPHLGLDHAKPAISLPDLTNTAQVLQQAHLVHVFTPRHLGGWVLQKAKELGTPTMLHVQHADQIAAGSHDADAIIVVEPHEATNQPSRLHHLPSAVSTEQLTAGDPHALHRQLDLPYTTPLVISTDPLTSKSQSQLLIDSFLGVSDNAHLVFAGDGSTRAAVEQHVHTLGASGHIHILPPVHHSHLPDIYAGASLVVSVAERGNHASLLHAAASGTPAVAVDSLSARSLIHHKQTGLLVPRNSLAIRRPLGHLLHNPYLCEQYGRAAKQHAKEQHSTTRATDRLLDVYALTRNLATIHR